MVPSGTVTFLFTDIEGSTAMWDNSPDAMTVALSRHDELLTAAMEAAGGYVFSTGGDGYATAFRSARDAVNAAVLAQRAVYEQRWDPRTPMRVRMGIHTGVADERAGNYFGAAVSKAARICAAACGGQVVLSAASADLVGDREWELVDTGLHNLAGFDRVEHLYRLIVSGVADVDAPLRTERARRVGNLPQRQARLIGRDDDLADVSSLVTEEPIVTLVGPGGVGKTRLAVAAGQRLGGSSLFPDGVWLVELAHVAAEHDVATAIVSVLRLRLSANRVSAASIADALGNQHRCIILDNCEHVLDAAADVVAVLADRCPSLRLLMTSREALGVDGERVKRVRPLAVLSSLGRSEAATLFCERVEGPLGRFDPTEAELVLVDEICGRLEGLPLAVELAAARVPTLGLGAVHERLGDVLNVLTRRRGEPRQQSLRATVAWSRNLLSADEQLVLDRLSVFTGSFDLDAASAVAADVGGRLEDHVASLVEKSLLSLHAHESPARYSSLEVVRQYGLEQLAERGEVLAARRRHLAHFTNRVAVADAGLCGADELRWHRALLAEFGNVRSAVRFAIEIDDADAARELLRSLHRWSSSRMQLEVGEWVDEVLGMESVTGDPATAVLMATSANFADMRSDWTTARRTIADAFEQERRYGPAPEPWVADIANALAQSAGEAEFESTLALLRARIPEDEYWQIYIANREGGRLAGRLFDRDTWAEQVDTTVARLRETVMRAERYGNPGLVARALGGLGVALRLADPEEAIATVELALAIGSELGLERLVSDTAQDLGMLLSTVGRHVDALSLLQPILLEHRRSGSLGTAWLTSTATWDALLAFGYLELVCTHLGLFRSKLNRAPNYAEPLFVSDSIRRNLEEQLGPTEMNRLLASGKNFELAIAVDQAVDAIDEVLARSDAELFPEPQHP
jgi:predicted ATPase/class 3 adenylate cyclase